MPKVQTTQLSFYMNIKKFPEIKKKKKMAAIVEVPTFSCKSGRASLRPYWTKKSPKVPTFRDMSLQLVTLIASVSLRFTSTDLYDDLLDR